MDIKKIINDEIQSGDIDKAVRIHPRLPGTLKNLLETAQNKLKTEQIIEKMARIILRFSSALALVDRPYIISYELIKDKICPIHL